MNPGDIPHSSLSDVDFLDSSGQVPYQAFIQEGPPKEPRNQDGSWDVEQVNKLFEETLINMDMVGNKRQRFDKYGPEQRWNFVLMNYHRDKSVPAPEYIVNQLKAHRLIISGKKEKLSSLLESCHVHLNTSNIRWATRFYAADGHLVLLSIASRYIGCIDGFTPLTKEEGDVLVWVLSCIRAICNSGTGLKLVTQYSSCIPMFVNGIYPQLTRTVENILQILIAFILSYNQLGKGEHAIRLLLTSFSSLKRGHHGWKVLTQIIDDNPKSPNLQTSVFAFLNSIFTVIFPMASLRTDWLLELDRSGLLSALRKVPRETLPQLPILIESFESELGRLRVVSPPRIQNAYNMKQVVRTLIDKSEPKYVIPSVILSLLDISVTNDALFKYVSIFLHNLLMVTRFQNEGAPEQRVAQASAIAKDLENPIVLRMFQEYDETDLAITAMYQTSDEMEQQPVVELLQEASGKKKEFVFEGEVESPSKNNELIISEYEEELKRANKMIESLRSSTQTIIDSKDKIIAENERLKKENQQFQNQAKIYDGKIQSLNDQIQSLNEQIRQLQKELAERPTLS